MATPSHVDLSTLWVPIMPSTDGLNAAMEQVGQDATESFGKGSEKLGDKIHESVTKSKDKIKDVFHRTGSDAGKSMSDAFKEETKAVEAAAGDAGEKASSKFREKAKDLGAELVGAIGPDIKRELGARVEDVVGGAFKMALGDDGVGKQISEAIGGAANQGITSWIGDLQKKLGDTKAAAATTRQAFADFGKGDTTAGVSKLVDSFGKLGIEAKDLPQPLQDAIGKLDQAKSTAKDFADIFTGLPGKIGAVGKAIEGLAGPLAVALQARQDMDEQLRLSGIDPNAKGDANKTQIEDDFKRFHRDSNGNIVVGPPKPKAPGVDMGGVTGLGRGGDVLGSNSDAYDAFSSGQPLPSPVADLPSSFIASSGVNLSTIPIAAQKYANDCIDASARIILSHSGINMTEDQMMGVIAPGGTIDSQAAGMNRLNPAGGFKALAGSGGSPAAMFAAIKASIDSGAGSVLNVAPGSSLAGRNFADGHFIAATGYNPDGTINLSDTARGTKYSVSAADAFQATRGRGIVAGTGRGPAGGAGPASPLDGGSGDTIPMPSMPRAGGTTASGDKIPTGAQHDPFYVMPSDKGGGAAGGGSSLAQSFGSSLLGGVAQSVGLDGSVFKTFSGASNPMDFGIAKLGTSLINMFAPHAGGSAPGMPLAGMDARHASILGLQPTPPGASPDLPSGEMVPGSGGGMGGLQFGPGAGGALNAAFGAAINLAGAAASDLFSAGPGAPDTANGAYWNVTPMPARGKGESVTHNHGDTHIDQSFHVTNNGVKGNGQEEYKAAMNSSGRTAALSAGLPG